MATKTAKTIELNTHLAKTARRIPFLPFAPANAIIAPEQWKHFHEPAAPASKPVPYSFLDYIPSVKKIEERTQLLQQSIAGNLVQIIENHHRNIASRGPGFDIPTKQDEKILSCLQKTLDSLTGVRPSRKPGKPGTKTGKH